jgi:hypothetical protein
MTVAIAPSAGGLTDSDRFCLFFGINSGRKAIIHNDGHNKVKREWELSIINYELGRWVSVF